jgi:hypothetical protein
MAGTVSGGLNRRTDHPDRDVALQHRLLVGGLDDVGVRPEPAVSLGAVS